MGSIVSATPLHVVLFPFMSKGHTIPVLHLARFLLHRNASVTIFTTPANRLFISKSLSDTNATIINIPFPENIPGIPLGIESTDKLPSISLFIPLASSTKLMKPHFETILQTLPFVTFMITDGFLGWTLDSANKFNIPRLVYYGMSNFAITIARIVSSTQLFQNVDSDEKLVQVPDFPGIKLAKNDLEPVFTSSTVTGPHVDFIVEQAIATCNSYGLVTNSFYELEPKYLDYWNSEFQPKSWCVGPFCVAEPVVESVDSKPWIKWLDKKLDRGVHVLYVAFGSQAEVSREQFEEIKVGLEKSEVSFLWVVRGKEWDGGDGFEERVKERGMVVREWVDQQEILGHECVTGFLSHCGWNSVLESICAKVPILAWPMMAEQPLNARMVTDDIKVGLRVDKCNDGLVRKEELEKKVKELMEGEMGKEARKKVREMGQAAIEAVKEGGSSWHTLNLLIDQIHAKRHL